MIAYIGRRPILLSQQTKRKNEKKKNVRGWVRPNIMFSHSLFLILYYFYHSNTNVMFSNGNCTHLKPLQMYIVLSAFEVEYGFIDLFLDQFHKAL